MYYIIFNIFHNILNCCGRICILYMYTIILTTKIQDKYIYIYIVTGPQTMA